MKIFNTVLFFIGSIIISFSANAQASKIETIKNDSFNFIVPSIETVHYLFELSQQEWFLEMEKLGYKQDIYFLDSSILYLHGRFGKALKIFSIFKDSGNVSIVFNNFSDSFSLLNEIEKELQPYFIEVVFREKTYIVNIKNRKYYFRLYRSMDGIEELFVNIIP
jgi:hypothetical protein